jgi:hypothetical protein
VWELTSALLWWFGDCHFTAPPVSVFGSLICGLCVALPRLAVLEEWDCFAMLVLSDVFGVVLVLLS